MPRRGLRTPAGLTKTIARRTGGRTGSLFEVSGVLFDSEEIYSHLDKRAVPTFEAMGRALRRDMRRGFRLAQRYTSIDSIPKDDPFYKGLRRRARIQEEMWRRGGTDDMQPPELPFVASKAGNIPKIRSSSSPLKRGILFNYDPNIGELVVGAARMARTKGIAPGVLEHGGTSNNSKIAARPFASRSLKKLDRNGRLVQIFAKKMRV